MIKVALVRGKYLNNYEGQNYRFDKKKIAVTGIASRFPIDAVVDYPIIKLSSLSDIDNRLTKAIANRTLGDNQILFGLKKFSQEFDIFHSADPHYYYSYQLSKLKRLGLIKKLLITFWETIPFNNETVRRKKLIKRFSMDYADLFLCYTERAKKCLIDEGIRENRIKVIKLGVDLSRFKIKKRQSNQLTLLFVGRLVEEKGVLDLYRAFRKIKQGRLIIIGKGPLKRKLKEEIRRDGLEDGVAFESRTYRQMPAIYQQADILIMPSKKTKTWEEQYGMVLIEAMASGLPIIAYDTGAIGENLGEAGVLVRENNADSLARQISSLIRNKNLRIKLGTMGRNRAEKFFDSRATALKIQNLYETLNSNSD